MKKVLVFDLDGTIIDTLYSIAYSCNQALTNHHYEPSEVKDYINYVGDGMKELVLRAMKLKEPNEDYQAICNMYQENYAKYQIDLAKPFDGMEETLKRLKEKGYHLACISNKPDLNVKEMVEHFYPGLFEYKAGQKDEVKRKPHEESLCIMADFFNVKKEEIAYIGDSHVDALFAKNFGCDLYLATYGYERKENLYSLNPLHFFDKPEDLINYF